VQDYPDKNTADETTKFSASGPYYDPPSPTPHNPEVQIMDLIWNSGLKPVVDGLRVHLEVFRNLLNRQELIWHALSLIEHLKPYGPSGSPPL
jgi:hypothetical protein